VTQTSAAQDGTPLFNIAFTIPAQKGNSGSPVLDTQDRVVGLFAWYSATSTNLGVAQGNAILTNSCR